MMYNVHIYKHMTYFKVAKIVKLLDDVEHIEHLVS